MTIQRTWKYRLYPTPSQAAELERQLGLLCDVYNSALEQRRRMWRDHGASIGFAEQSRQLTEARGELAWVRSMNALAQHGALKRLDRAFDAFFRRCAAGEKPGYRASARDAITTRSPGPSTATVAGSPTSVSATDAWSFRALGA